MRLLLIEDDEMLGKATVMGLKMAYAVDWVRNAEDAEDAMATTPYDLVVSDINLPKKSGLDLVRSMRAAGDMKPVLMLTARDGVSHRIEGLNTGADDYLVKPFDLDELLARIAALIRRSQGRAAPYIEYGDIRFDVGARSVLKAGRTVPLSGRELAVLEIVMSNIGKVISKTQIEGHIYDWDNAEKVESNTVEVHISALRRKLGRDFIKTIRGVGYVIEP
ncbi:MAG: response regulator transcription factor [Rhodospirillales bacterium]|nr:response regulator transcription factor [Alphaproteobacteria bacterium]MCB9986375.1 response regulator transcription factor [Rhodospirillales bacterium]USO07076.1 MAG: response regulator transcription factor [Rhodospirillales bacterium]